MNDIDAKIDNAPELPAARENEKPEVVEHEEAEPETPESSEPETPEPESDDDSVDEYGNEIPKQEKTYTEAQVQAMIRDRLSRGNHGQQPQQPQQPQQQPQSQPNSQDFEYDANSSQTWEEQLEYFMDGWASKREKRQQEQQWQAQEQQKQSEFEGKFTAGMSRYNDFQEVVNAQPIDDAMVMATRGMNDPAAFLYAAAKKQPAELQRIAQIADPYSKMMEMGRLDERMKKDRKSKSNAPKPGSNTKGDTTGKPEPRSLDDKIRKYAEKNLRRG